MSTFGNVTVYDKTMRAAKCRRRSLASFLRKKINLTHIWPNQLSSEQFIKLSTIVGQNGLFWLTHYDLCSLLHKGRTCKAEKPFYQCSDLWRNLCVPYFHSTNKSLRSKIYHKFYFKRCWVIKNKDCTSCSCMFPRQLEQRKNIGCHIFECTAHMQDKVFFRNKP